jgi:hypothetical protein
VSLCRPAEKNTRRRRRRRRRKRRRTGARINSAVPNYSASLRSRFYHHHHHPSTSSSSSSSSSYRLEKVLHTPAAGQENKIKQHF